MTFRHASVGTSSLNRIASSSRLATPAAVGPAAVPYESPHDPHIARRPPTRALVLLN
jgi:hypothetical protein